MSRVLQSVLENYKSCLNQMKRLRFCTNADGNHDIQGLDIHKESVIKPRILPFMPAHLEPVQAWVENLNTVKEEKLGIIDLHPDVFGAIPRMDMLFDNIQWQRMYRKVTYTHHKSRAELRGGGRKPWPQKGMGRARHGSIRSPLWKNGGSAHGPRPFRPYFFMLPFSQRLHGLISALSAKMAQDDLHIVDSLEIPTPDKEYIEELMERRHWGFSVLFVDSSDIMPRNITIATDDLGHVNLMPVYGLNVWSMLKHDTLVLTSSAVDLIEERLIYFLNKNNDWENKSAFLVNQQ